MNPLGSTGGTISNGCSLGAGFGVSRVNSVQIIPGTRNQPANACAASFGVSPILSTILPIAQLLIPMTRGKEPISMLNTRPRYRLSASRCIRVVLNTQITAPHIPIRARLTEAVQMLLE